MNCMQGKWKYNRRNRHPQKPGFSACDAVLMVHISEWKKFIFVFHLRVKIKDFGECFYVVVWNPIIKLWCNKILKIRNISRNRKTCAFPCSIFAELGYGNFHTLNMFNRIYHSIENQFSYVSSFWQFWINSTYVRILKSLPADSTIITHGIAISQF